jgi:hypothetical protein
VPQLLETKSRGKKYFATDATSFDEKGRAMDKAALVKDLSPLPLGYSGSIRVLNPKSLFLWTLRS